MKELPAAVRAFVDALPTHAQCCAAANAVNHARVMAPESEAKLHELEMALWFRAGQFENLRGEKLGRGRAQKGSSRS